MPSFRKRRGRPLDQTGLPYGQNEVTFTARRVRKLIKYIGTILFAVFAFLQLKDFQVGSFVESISPDLLRRVTLILYYWCWIFGSTFDTDVQEIAYFTDKGRFKLSATAVALIVLFGCVAAVLFWAADGDQKFAAALALFFALNILGFAYILWFIAPIIVASRNRYVQGKNFFSMAQLDIVTGYMTGAWQWYRFGLGFVLVIVIDLICFNDATRMTIAQYLSLLFQTSSADSLAERLPTLMFVAFVLLMEGWIWIQRARTSVSLALLEKLSEKYKLVPSAPGA
jgi:hypothetical protein